VVFVSVSFRLAVGTGARTGRKLLPAAAAATAMLAWSPKMLTLPAFAAAAAAKLPLWLTMVTCIVVRAGRSSIFWSSNMGSPQDRY